MNNAFRILTRSIAQITPHGRLLEVSVLSSNTINKLNTPIRAFSFTTITKKGEEEEGGEITPGEQKLLNIIEKDPTRNRRTPITAEVSVRYLKSKAFKDCYGDEPVWRSYRRNYKGPYPPKTRKSCIRAGVIATGNPCPICRDEYLIVHYTNVDLIKQFVSPTTGKIMEWKQSNVCQKQHANLLVAYIQAKNLGLLTFDVPFRNYDYSEYMQQ